MTWGIAVDYLLATLCALIVGSLTAIIGWLVVMTIRDSRQLEIARSLQVQRYMMTLADIRAMLTVWSDPSRRLS
jgi:hypothetical protein